MPGEAVGEMGGASLPSELKVEENESLLWRGFIVTCNFFYETPASIIAITVIGIVANFFFLPLALGCYFLAFSSLAGRVIVKICSSFGSKPIERVEEWILQIKRGFPYLQKIAVVIALVTSCFFPSLGSIVALFVGCYSGMLFEIEHCKLLQECEREKVEEQNGGRAFDIIIQ